MFDLPVPDRYRLARPPLVLALVQINYPIVGKLQTLEGITPFQEAIRGAFPYMQKVQVDQIAFMVGPGSAAPTPSSERVIGWRFNDDAKWTLDVNPGVAQLSIGREYTTVEDMESRFRVMLRALRDSAGINRCDRLGLRFIDFAELTPDQPTGWIQWFRPELVGWAGTEIFADGATLQSHLQQTALATTPLGGSPVDAQAMIRNGLVPAGTVLPRPDGTQETLANYAYVLDQDFFVAGSQPFDEERLASQFKALHSEIDKFFRWCLTPVGVEHFGLESK